MVGPRKESMQRALLVLPLVLLSSCATGPYAHMQNTAAYRDCEYKAKVATPRTSNAIADGWREAELRDLCMANKGL